MAFSPDGNRVVTGSLDKTAIIWNARSGEKVIELKHGDPVNRVMFSSNGAQVVTESSPYATLWDARTGEKLGEVSAPD